MRKLTVLLSSLLLGVTACSSSNDKPSISAQPAGATVLVGATATFGVTASGARSYQWLRNGAAVAGATSASYTTPATAAADDHARFSVTVTNDGGTVTSAEAELRVVVAPQITGQPASAAVLEGQEMTLSVTATGNGTLSYQWAKDGSDVDGATTATLHVPAAVLGDSGSYSCTVTNAIGGLQLVRSSSPATVSVVDTPVITAQPVGGTIFPGDSFSLRVAASGAWTLGYQWRKDGVAIAGATSATYTLASATSGDGGAYTCDVSNGTGGVHADVTSAAASVAVQLTPSIVGQSGNVTTFESLSAAFSVSARGANLTYRWQHGGVDVPGGISATLALPAVAMADAGAYHCVVANGDGSVTSADVTLTVKPLVDTFEASATTLSLGEGVILLYAFDPAATGTLSAGGAPPEPVTSGGSSVVYPTENTTYTLTTVAPGGSPVARSVSVAVKTYTPKNLYVTNAGTNDVSRYTISLTGPSLVTEVSGSTPAGAAPIHVAASPDETRLYVSNSGDGTVSAYDVDGSTGALTAVAGSPFALSSASASPWASAMTPDGKWLYVACAEGIEVLSAGAGGALTLQPSRAVAIAGRGQGDLVVHPSGGFLAVADHGNGGVSTYAIDAATGALSFTGHVPSFSSPSGLTFDRAGALLFTRGTSATLDFNAGIDVYAVDPYALSVVPASTHAGYAMIDAWGVEVPFVRGNDVSHGLAYSRQPGVDMLFNSYDGEFTGYTCFSAYRVNTTTRAITGDLVDGVNGFSSPLAVQGFNLVPDAGSIVVDRSGAIIALPIPVGWNTLYAWIQSSGGALNYVGGLMGQDHWSTGEAPSHGVFTGTLQ